MMSKEAKERKNRLKELVKEIDDMSEFAAITIKEGLVVSMSEGRRIYCQLK